MAARINQALFIRLTIQRLIPGVLVEKQSLSSTNPYLLPMALSGVPIVLEPSMAVLVSLGLLLTLLLELHLPIQVKFPAKQLAMATLTDHAIQKILWLFIHLRPQTLPFPLHFMQRAYVNRPLAVI